MFFPSTVVPCLSHGHAFPSHKDAQQPGIHFVMLNLSVQRTHSQFGCSLPIRQYILASSLSSFFFSGQIYHFLEYFYIIAAELIWWHTANVGLHVYILLQPAMTLDRGLLRCMHFKSLHITLESVKWSSNKRVKFSSRDLSAYCCFDERGNSNIILIAVASSHAWGLSCRPKWALTPC